MGVIVAGSTIATVRVPELQALLDSPGLMPEDLIIVFQTATNTTQQTTVAKLMAYFQSGGGGTTTISTIQIGNRVIHIVTKAEADAHATQILIPQLAGVVYNMTRGSQPLIPGEEFEILTAGGVKLPQALIDAGDYYHEGERLVFDIYDYGSNTSIINNGGGSFISDVYTIDSNVSLASSRIGQMGQVRAGSSAITVTLPSVADSTGQGCMFFEADINNSIQTKIQAVTGQKIYLNGIARDFVHISWGEVLYLLKRPDGWYVANNFGSYYRELGKVKQAFKAEIHELPLIGQEVLRIQFPRLFEYVQTLGSSYVTEAQWQTASAVDSSGVTVSKPYRGCFSQGNGTTSFRLPDFRKVTVRGLHNNGVGSDVDRILNRAGGYQGGQMLAHNHRPVNDANGTGYGFIPLSIPGQSKTTGTADATNSGSEPNVINAPVAPVTVGGTETRMENIGLYYVINV